MRGKLAHTFLASFIMVCSVPQSSFAAPALAAIQIIQFGMAELAHITEYSQQVQQYTTAASQLQQDIQSVQMAQQNLKTLSASDLSNYNSYIDQLKNNMVATNGFAHTASDLDQQFSEKFPGYASAQSRKGAASFSEYYKSLTDTNRGTALGTLKNLQASSNDLTSDVYTMNSLKLQSRNSTGNLEAIQAANEIAMHQTDTLKKLHVTMLNQASLMSVKMASENDKRASDTARVDTWRTSGRTATKGDEKNIQPWKTSK